MQTNKLRSLFLNYFEKLDHALVQGDSLVPHHDPTLLFTNAGMVPFKDVFLGQEKRSYTRATSSQPCVRAGGKHNDLENVGYTARHHTFFEMLGNFSFGDYFKREAIQFAWNFLTKELHIPEEKLWVTVFREDDEAADVWLKEMQIDPERFSRCDEADNFWSMGDTGPCGPCSEIFYDHGESIFGGPPGSLDQEGDRYVEIWNLVFMQYDRDKSGRLNPLPKPSVDTGMGLERIAAVMQGVHNNYDIDIFQHLISALSNILGINRTDENDHAFKVIADHIRSSVFLIKDGATPSNEHRGYVLRRIIRRALRYGHKLGMNQPFFYQLVAPLVEVMGEAYPALEKMKNQIESVLKQEEAQFIETLAQGLKILNTEIQQMEHETLSGDVVFRLYDTYGFPPDLTEDIAREQGIDLDHAGFDECMKAQRSRSQQASQFELDDIASIHIEGETAFTGYKKYSDIGKVIALVRNNQKVDNLVADDEGMVVLDRTPFYAESGGQVGDTGELRFQEGIFQVTDTRKHGDVYLHYGFLKKGKLNIGDQVESLVDSARNAIMLNHSATHLLHAALREILGDQVIQKGSLVEAARLRFDFAYPNALSQDQLKKVEQLVNQKIRDNLVCHIDVMSPDEAIEKGALALFGEKYDDQVRMLSMGDFSKELCGGTHVDYTGKIGFFKITNGTGIASGVRRIEALTGQGALDWVLNIQMQMNELMTLLKATRKDVTQKLKQTLASNQKLEKALIAAKQKLAHTATGDIQSQFRDIAGVDVLSTCLDGVDLKTLRGMVDQLKQGKDKAAIVLATVVEHKVHLVAGVTKSCEDVLRAGDLVSYVAVQIDGKGGGRGDMAQGGGNNPEKLAQALDSVFSWVADKLD